MKKIKFIFGIFVLFMLFINFVYAGAGGGAVPITTVDLTEQGSDYTMKPGRLKFEFDGQLYAIQVRRVKEDYTDFLIMTLDMSNLDDITAYTLDDTFSLKSNEKKEIDLDKDGIKDLSVELDGILSTGVYSSVRGADFSIKQINVKKLEVGSSSEESIIADEGGIVVSNDGAMETESVEIIEEEIEESVSGEVTEGNVEIEEPILELVDQEELQEELTFFGRIANFFRSLFK